jgi:hypothetical protein
MADKHTGKGKDCLKEAPFYNVVNSKPHAKSGYASTNYALVNVAALNAESEYTAPVTASSAGVWTESREDLKVHSEGNQTEVVRAGYSRLHCSYIADGWLLRFLISSSFWSQV